MHRLLSAALVSTLLVLAPLRAAPSADELEPARAALARAEASHGPDSPEALAALEALIEARRQSQDQSFAGDEVGAWIERALASSERLRGGDAPGTIERRIDAAYRESDLQHHEPARALADDARVRAERTGDALLVAKAAYAQGLVSHTAKHFDQAEPPLREALARLGDARKAGGAKSELDHFEARIELLLGETMAQTGRFDEAKARVGHSIALAQGLGPAGDRSRRRALGTLAEIETRRGEYNAALRHFDQALALLPADAPPRVRVDFLFSYANALARSGDHERSLGLVRECLELETRIDPPRQRNRGLQHFLLATELMALGQPDAALPEFEAAQRDMAAVFKPGHPAFALIENNLGNLYLALDRNDEAQVHHRRALELFPEKQVPERWFPHAGLGTALLREGRLAEAHAEFSAALAGLEQSIGPSNYATSFVRTGLAATYWAQGDLEQAFAQAVAAERARQGIVGEIAPEFSERHAIALKDALEPSDDWVIALAAASGDPERVRTAWELAIQARGTVTQSIALRQAAARAAHDSKLAPRWQQWLAANAAYAEALVASSNAPKPDAAALEAPRIAYEAAERELGREVVAVGSARARSRTRVAELEQALPEHGALVVFATLKHSAPSHYDRQKLGERERKVYALVLEQGGAPRLLALGSQAEIEAAAGAWAEATRDPSGSPERLREAGATVRRLVWQPLGLDARPRPVFVLADGALARVNLAALPDGDARFLVERGFAFHHLEHERDLLAAVAARPQRLVLVGAPDFGRGAKAGAGDGTPSLRAQCPGLRGTRFSALPYAREELDELARIWRGAGTTDATLLAGAAANEDAVRRRLAGGGIVHFATHGVYLGESCGAAASGTRAFSVVAAEGVEAPRASSGLGALALSGANRDKATTSADDGLLTSEEIMALDLAGTDWAVLSACETGLGKSVHGEGVFGLRRAFRLAGARTVVMSLWPVQDEATRDWMAALYRARLERRLSTIESVARAERELLAARRAAGQSTHPFYWAAFVAAGDWR